MQLTLEQRARFIDPLLDENRPDDPRRKPGLFRDGLMTEALLVEGKDSRRDVLSAFGESFEFPVHGSDIAGSVESVNAWFG